MLSSWACMHACNDALKQPAIARIRDLLFCMHQQAISNWHKPLAKPHSTTPIKIIKLTFPAMRASVSCKVKIGT